MSEISDRVVIDAILAKVAELEAKENEPELPIGQLLRDLRLENEALKRQLDEARAQDVWCSRYAWGAFDALRSRVAKLEELIIEADAAYNTDHKHMPIETAELALVTMAYQGSDALMENATLISRVAELEAERRWIPINSTYPAPEIGDMYLVWASEYCCYGNETAQDPKINGSYFSEDITHWMPLPQGPEVEG